MTKDTTSEGFFEAKYAASGDPWKFATSSYERDRYASIFHALVGRRYARAFEPGCSIGILTRQLAQICDSVEAIDISPTAVAAAVQTCRDRSNVKVARGALPDVIPAGVFDLIVFSEIGYYFEPAVLSQIATRLVDRLTPRGVFLAAHWLGDSQDHLLSGDEVHGLLDAMKGMEKTLAERHEAYRIERWTKL
jgi:SAM-dependent methyltransferase